jgi:hypothetical protein
VLPNPAGEILDVVGHALEVAIGFFRNLEAELRQLFRDQPRIIGRIGQPADFGVVGIADDQREPRCRVWNRLFRLVGGRQGRAMPDHNGKRDHGTRHQRFRRTCSHRSHLASSGRVD